MSNIHNATLTAASSGSNARLKRASAVSVVLEIIAARAANIEQPGHLADEFKNLALYADQVQAALAVTEA